MPTSHPVDTAPASTNRHPLNEFYADVEDIVDVTRPQRNNDQRNNTFIQFNMAGLEVVSANEPYNFPTTQVEIMEINIPGSGWEVWKESVRKCGYSGDINGLIHKRLHWKWSEALMNLIIPGSQPARYENRMGSCFQVIGIEGIANTSDKLLDATVATANGRDAAQFKSTFMANNDIRQFTGYSDMLVEVAGNRALNTLVAAGKLTVDASGIYHSV